MRVPDPAPARLLIWSFFDNGAQIDFIGILVFAVPAVFAGDPDGASIGFANIHDRLHARPAFGASTFGHRLTQLRCGVLVGVVFDGNISHEFGIRIGLGPTSR